MACRRLKRDDLQTNRREVVTLAKEIIEKCNLDVNVQKLTDCKDDFFVSVYQSLIGDNLKGLVSNPLNKSEHIHNCQSVIDSLAKDILNVDLSHISATSIVDGDVISISNLLEIFSGLLEYFIECIDENQSDYEDDFDDSNVITTDHDVLSSLLREEFGRSSYRNESKMGKDKSSMEKQPIRSQRNNSSRMTTDPSIRVSSFTGSGHEADSSEISDSTNELIKLGESNSSNNSSVRRTEPLRKSLQKGLPKTTWQHSALSDHQQELTQYTMTSDDGHSFDLQDTKNQSSEHLSSSLISSTSSWRKQISPLDGNDNGIELDTIGLRPRVDQLTTSGKDCSEDGVSSGRSTPILHHHYHHHFHHQADSKQIKSDNIPSSQYAKIQEYKDIPGNIKASSQVSSTVLPGQTTSEMLPRASLPAYVPGQLFTRGVTSDNTNRLPGIHTQGVGIGDSLLTNQPGQSHFGAEISKIQGNSRLGIKQGVSSVPLTDYSRNIPGHSITSTLPTSVLPSYTMSGSGLPGKGLSSQRIPISEYSRTSVPGQHIRSGHTGFTSSVTSNTSSYGTNVLPNYMYTKSGSASSKAFGISVTGQITSTRTTFSEQNSRPEMSDQSRVRTSFQDYGPTRRLPGTKTSLVSHGIPDIVQSDNSRLRSSHQADRPTISVTSSASLSYPHIKPTRNSMQLSTNLKDTATGDVSGQKSLHEHYLTSGTSLVATTSLPSSSGLQTVSSGGYTDVFTNTDTSKQDIPPIRTVDAWQPRESARLQRSQEPNKDIMVITTSKDSLPSSVLAIQPLDDEDSDDSDGARYSDSAVDYNRGGNEVDSDDESSQDSILRRIHDRWKRLKLKQSTRPSAQRGVTFNDDIETIPITSRMDRLRQILDDEEKEQIQQTAALRDVYAEQLQDIQKQHQQERKENKKRKVQKSPLAPKKKTKKTALSKQRGRLEAIYRPQGRPGRPTKRPPVKKRKRSASASPDIGRRRKNTLVDFHESLLPSLFEEFPFLHVSPQTTHAMWQKQARQVSLLNKSETTALKSKSQRRVEEAEQRQERLLKILRKELEHNQRMRSERERKDHQRTIKAKVNEKRQIAARARRYYDEYQLRMRAKMLKRRTREEQILKKLFDDGLEIQKQRVRELRKYAKEKAETIEQKQSNEIQSLEN